MQLVDAFLNTGKPDLNDLRSKHPEARAPSDTSLNAYPGRPTELVPDELREETVIEVAQRLPGGAKSGVTD